MVKRWWWVVLGTMACSEVPSEATLTLNIPWLGSQTIYCDAATLSAAGADVVAYVILAGGFSDCVLTVDDTDLSASGVCDGTGQGIPTGTVRPFLIAYALQETVDSDHTNSDPFAFYVGFVNLRSDQLKNGQDVVEVPLADDRIVGEFVYTNAQLQALSTDLCPFSGDALANLDSAKSWAQCEFVAPGGRYQNDVLDLNSDGTENIQDMCDGVPYK